MGLYRLFWLSVIVVLIRSEVFTKSTHTSTGCVYWLNDAYHLQTLSNYLEALLCIHVGNVGDGSLLQCLISLKVQLDVPLCFTSYPLPQVLCGRGCEALLSGDLEGVVTQTRGVQLVEQHIHKWWVRIQCLQWDLRHRLESQNLSFLTECSITSSAYGVFQTMFMDGVFRTKLFGGSKSCILICTLAIKSSTG